MSKEKVEKVTETAVVNWADKFAEEAKIISESIKMGPISISTKGGLMKIEEKAVTGNKFLCCIIADTKFNALYSKNFKDGEITAPVCYAYGDDDSLQPHVKCEAKANSECSTCPNNQWGSAVEGRGKLCSNNIKLGLVILGKWDNKQDAYVIDESEATYNGQVYILNVPPTSTKAYNVYKKAVADTMKRPLYAVVTEVICEAGSPFKLAFSVNDIIGVDEKGDQLPNAGKLFDIVVNRRFEVLSALQRPYEQFVESPASAKKY